VLKLKTWFQNYRFLVALIALLIVFAFVFACLSHSSGDSWKDTLRALCSNLAAESLGAIISIIVIGWFLERHQEQNLRRVRVVVLRHVCRLSYRTIDRSVSIIPQPGRDEPVYELASAFIELLDIIHKHDFSLAIVKLRKVFRDLPSLNPETFSKVRGLAYDLQPEWIDLLDTFQQYLTPDQFACTVKIIKHLESLVFQCRSIEGLLEIVGGIDAFMDGGDTDTFMYVVANTPLESGMTNSLTELNEEVLSLLQFCA